MSILRHMNKHHGYDVHGKRTPFAGGGGGGPSQTTSYQTNIPSYAQPYVENMLGATQAQLFNTTVNPETGRTEISGFRPYTPYSTNVNDYVAGFSPLQQQAFSEISGLGRPQQFAMGTEFANKGGQGLLSTTAPAMAYGTQGADIGKLGIGASQMGFGAGQAYEQAATTPGDVARYMSPYMQNVVDYQKSQALRDYQMAAPMRQAAAVGQGAFGGNRLALQQSEAQRGLMSQLQGIEATGAQKAFDAAQQAQQFRANLGLQGLGAGYQGLGLGLQGVQTGLQGVQGAQAGYQGAVGAGSALGNIGAQQSQSDLARIALMAQLGGTMQGQEQQKINQAISDYATAQQYPMLQLGLMSNMLRGLPMQAQTTQMYQAAPSYMQQGIGAAGSLASLYGAGRKEGGIIGYKYGGAISEPKLASMADKLDIAQLQQRLKDPQLDAGERQIFADALQDKAKDKARYAGIAAAGGGLFEGQGYAGGGILAFADEGEVKDPQALADQINLIGAQLDTINAEAAGKNAPGSRQKAYKPAQAAEYENLKKRQGELQTEYSNLMSKAGLDKPAFNYQPSRSLGGGVPTNSVEQALLGQKPPVTPTQPTQAEWNAFDDATARYVAEQKAKNEAAPAVASQGAKAPGTPSTGVQSTSGKSLADLLAERKALGPQGEAGEDFMKFIEDRLGSSEKRLGRADKLAMAKAFSDFGSKWSPGGIGAAANRALGVYTDEYGKAISAEDAITLEAQKMRKDLDVARRAEARGDVEGAQKAYDAVADRQNRIQIAQIQAAASMAGHGATQKAEAAAIERIMKDKGIGFTEALQLYKGAGKMESNDINAIKASIEVLQNSLLSPGMSKEDRAKVQKQIAGLNQQLMAIGSRGGAPTGGGNIMRFDAQGNLVKG